MARFRPDPAFAREVTRTADFRRILDDALGPAVARARALSPDDPNTGTPDLPTSIVAEVELTAEHGYRGRLAAHNWKAGWYEVGATGVRARPFLRPSVEETIGPIEPPPPGED